MNVELLKATKESIAADPHFNLADWSHCIAGHICRAAGLAVKEGSNMFGEEHIAQVARGLAGIGYAPGLYYRGRGSDYTNKQIAYDRIDKLIFAHQQEVQQEVEQLAEELVGV